MLSVDEKPRFRPWIVPSRSCLYGQGTLAGLPLPYKRNGTVNLMAALAVHTGESPHGSVDRNNSENFLKFLKHLDRRYRNVQIHIILHNCQSTKTRLSRSGWLKKENFHLHFTPTYSSWLNQIEIWFSIMSRKILKDGVWHSKKDLVDQLMSYIREYNETSAKPFNWTYGEEYLTN
ncbi:MAG: IS630 family transposase [Balneolaceae bacterium]|nr:IS630 family transposase [Balneolaceae bacterium]